jgi:hypothetical protein
MKKFNDVKEIIGSDDLKNKIIEIETIMKNNYTIID